jgi:hypothetical protein
MLVLEDGKMKGGQEKFIRDMCHSCLVHQQDRPALVIELPATLEDDVWCIRDSSAFPTMILYSQRAKKARDRDLRSSVGIQTQISYFKRVNLIMINLGCPNGTMMAGDLCDVGMGIYVSLDNQLPGLFVDSAEITGLFSLGKGRCSTH